MTHEQLIAIESFTKGLIAEFESNRRESENQGTQIVASTLDYVVSILKTQLELKRLDWELEATKMAKDMGAGR